MNVSSDATTTNSLKRTRLINNAMASVQASSFLYYAALAVFILSAYFERLNFGAEALASFSSIFDMLKAACIALIVLQLFIEACEGAIKPLPIAIILVLAGLTWVIGGSSNFFWLALFVVGAHRAKLNDVSRTVFICSMFAIVVTLVLWAVGFIEESTIANTADRFRHSFGYGHPNSAACMLMIALLSFSVPRFGEIPIIETMACVFVAACCLLLMDSRTYAAAVIVWALFLWVHYFTMGRRKSEVFITKLLFGLSIVVCLISILVMVLYKSDVSIFTTLDKAFSGRPYYSNYYFSLHQVSLFGFDYSVFGTKRIAGVVTDFLVDNAYNHFYLRFGLVSCALSAYCCVVFFRKAMREEYYGPALFGLALFALTGFAEASLFMVSVNFFTLVMACVIYEKPISSFDDVSCCLTGELSVSEVC